MRVLTASAICLAPLLWFGVPNRDIVGGAPVSPQCLAIDAETVIGRRHLSRGYPAQDGTGSVHAVIEIPTGTVAKFEVDEDDGMLRWALDRDDGSRRKIDYLAYPVNYGMVPSTLAEDGDPLDVLVLGANLERGHVAKTRIIGVLKMGHDETRDDKLIAVPVETELRNGFSELRDISELDESHPAVRQILTLWFSNYWGKGATTVLGWGDAGEAMAILKESSRARKTRSAEADLHPREVLPSAGRVGALVWLPLRAGRG